MTLDSIYLISFAIFLVSSILGLIKKESWNPTIKTGIIATRMLSSVFAITMSILEIELRFGSEELILDIKTAIFTSVAILTFSTLFFHFMSWSAGAKVLWATLSTLIIFSINEVILHTIPVATNYIRLSAGISLIIVGVAIVAVIGIIVFPKKEIPSVAN